jgi:arylsulfatase A-like enzyme
MAIVPDPRPDLIVVMADDHAAHAISAYGSRITTTPHIDRIAAGGMRFDAACCTNSLCAPSRAAILTGTYNHVNGVTTLGATIDARQPAFPALLHDAGYRTVLVGKWHLGHGGVCDPHGFDSWCVLPGQGDYRDPEMIDNGVTRRFPGYATDVITDLALAELRTRDPGRPLCLLVHHKAPHRPWEPDAAHAGQDLGPVPVPGTYDDDYSFRAEAARRARMRVRRDLDRADLKEDPPPGLTEDEHARWAYQRFITDYLRCVASLDDNVGRLLDAIDASGRETVVLYTSDQGFFLGDHGWFDKRFMYEESLRMPLLVRHPREVAPGSSTDALVVNVDFAPTLLDLAGVSAHPRMQGRSLRPLLRGERPANWRRSVYYRYWEHLDHQHKVAAHYGVRTATHKLVCYYGAGLGQPDASAETTPVEWELFDLERDPAELHSVHDDPAYADVCTELTAELARLQAEVRDEPYPAAVAR